MKEVTEGRTKRTEEKTTDEERTSGMKAGVKRGHQRRISLQVQSNPFCLPSVISLLFFLHYSNSQDGIQASRKVFQFPALLFLTVSPLNFLPPLISLEFPVLFHLLT